MARLLPQFALPHFPRQSTRLKVPTFHSHPYPRGAQGHVDVLAPTHLRPRRRQVSPTLSYHHSRCSSTDDHLPDPSTRSNQEGVAKGRLPLSAAAEVLRVSHVAVLREKCTLVVALALYLSRHSIAAVVAVAAAVADMLEECGSFQPRLLLEHLSDWTIRRTPRGIMT
jgi:hypothetical protein